MSHFIGTNKPNKQISLARNMKQKYRIKNGAFKMRFCQ